ncbi:hypothetical protein [Brucella pituitosa]|nr:hypothetical protein [Brucella pituitosa]
MFFGCFRTMPAFSPADQMAGQDPTPHEIIGLISIVQIRRQAGIDNI